MQWYEQEMGFCHAIGCSTRESLLLDVLAPTSFINRELLLFSSVDEGLRDRNVQEQVCSNDKLNYVQCCLVGFFTSFTVIANIKYTGESR